MHSSQVHPLCLEFTVSQACKQVRTMQGRLEGVLCRGRSISEDEILSHWRIRNWFGEEETLELALEGFQEKGIPNKGRARTKTQASIRLGICGVPTCAVGGSRPILSMAQ